jgi:hypothetical protein
MQVEVLTAVSTKQSPVPHGTVVEEFPARLEQVFSVHLPVVNAFPTFS